MKPTTRSLTPAATRLFAILADGQPHTVKELLDKVSDAKSRKAILSYVSRLRATGVAIEKDTYYQLKNVQPKLRSYVRKTARRATEETRRKVSKGLKEAYANGRRDMTQEF